MKNKKVLLITPGFSPNIGGVETHLDDLMEYFSQRKVKTDIITYQPLTTKINAKFYEEGKDCKIYRIPLLRNNLFYKLEKYIILQFFYLTLGILFFSFFYLLFNHNKFSVISAHGLSAIFAGSLLKKVFKIKLVATFHTNYKFFERPRLANFVKTFLNIPDEILVISSLCKNDLIQSNIRKNRITIYNNWVNENIFNLIGKKDSRKKIGLEDNKFYLLFVGRLTEEKGIKSVLEILPELDPEISLIVIGDGPLKKEILNLQNEFQNLIYKGFLDNYKLPYYFNACDVLVYAPVDEDYLGRVSISALACGMPILIPSTSFYHGKIKNNIFNFQNKKAGMRFTNNEELIKILHSLKNIGIEHFFNKKECIAYFNDNYGREKNGEIIFNTYFNN